MSRTLLLYISMFTTLSLFVLCNGKNIAKEEHPTALVQTSTLTIGDTVKELGTHLMLVFQDRANVYWFGSWGEGVYRYDGKTIIHFTTEDGLCQNKIVNIQQDQSGNLYFNTDLGVSKFDGQRFTTLRVSNTNEWKLHPDDLWFKGAQDSAVVYRYDGRILHRLIFPAIKQGDDYIAKYPRSKYPNMPFSPYDMYTIYKDGRGNVWFGSGVLGVCRYDGKSFDWITEDDVTELDDSPANGVRSIIEDEEGYFWFSNTVYRYNVYNTNSSDAVPFSYTREKGIGSLDGKQGGALDFYLSATKDANDDLWIATYNAGVWRYDGKSIVHYPVKEGDKAVTLFTIYTDNRGGLWLGTHDSGAYKFNSGKGIFERYKL